jgi:hypothetical protein
MCGNADTTFFTAALQCFVVANRTFTAQVSLIAFETFVFWKTWLLVAEFWTGYKSVGKDNLPAISPLEDRSSKKDVCHFSLRINLLKTVFRCNLYPVTAVCLLGTLKACV